MDNFDTPEGQTSTQLPPVEPPAPTRRRSGNRFFWGILGGCLFVFVLLTALGAIAAMMGSGKDGARFLPVGKVAVLPLDGPITESRDFIETLESYGESRTIKAIVVRIDSPGGMVVPSQEMYEAIKRVRSESGKPVVASIANTAASGGYYVAVACDPIVANRGSVTGSIGVIAQWFNMEELARWAKLDPETIKSGRWKDVPNPLRELSEEERSYYQHLLDQLHGQFIAAVIEGRKGKMNADQVRSVADGRVFLGEQAVRLRLVDQIGTLEEAIKIAASAGGLGDDPAVLYPKPREPRLLDLIAGGGETARALLERIPGSSGIRFLYRWN